MEEEWRPEFAEAIPFSRASMAQVLKVPPRTLNNWIDRHKLWQTPRHGYYRLGDVFDLAGFAAMRTANITEQSCARYVRNFGFYGLFLHGDQYANFSHRNGEWDIGIYDPSAVITLRINMRTVGESIFRGISELFATESSDRALENFLNFKRLFLRAVELDRLWLDSVPLFSGGEK